MFYTFDLRFLSITIFKIAVRKLNYSRYNSIVYNISKSWSRWWNEIYV